MALKEAKATFSSISEERALYNALEALPTVQLIELEALMWLGRGDYETLESAIAAANESTHHSAPYLIEKAPLWEYLYDGLEKLNLPDLPL